MLTASWNNCWKGVGAAGDGAVLMGEVLAAYAEPARRYHTAEHLSDCLTLLREHRELSEFPAEVELACWFHDAIYEVKAVDNEARSAHWAVEALSRAGAPPEKTARVRQSILATRHSEAPVSRDAALLADLDMGILAAPRARFDRYEAQIREEFAWVPEALFRTRRAALLQGWLSRPHLYHTPRLRALWEQTARDHLAYSLEKLLHVG